MLGAVQRKKNIRVALRLSSVAMVTAIGLWWIQMIDHELPSIEYADQSESPPLEFISDYVPEIEIVETTGIYVHYLSVNDVSVQLVDDEDLEQIFDDRAYAIVDNGKTNERTFHLLTREEG